MTYSDSMVMDPRELLKPFARETAVPVDARLAGTTGDRVQRVQIGLFGLVSMVLVVALADIVLSRADKTEAASVPEAAPTVAATEPAVRRDPLADAGVVPELPADTTVQKAPAPSQETGDVPPPSLASPQ